MYVVRLTENPDMTIAVYYGRKTNTLTNKNSPLTDTKNGNIFSSKVQEELLWSFWARLFKTNDVDS